jgi:hypothetical protein
MEEVPGALVDEAGPVGVSANLVVLAAGEGKRVVEDLGTNLLHRLSTDELLNKCYPCERSERKFVFYIPPFTLASTLTDSF